MVFCSSCGLVADGGNAFCPGCGGRLGGGEARAAPAPGTRGNTHIGDMNGRGEWLGHVVSHMLRFAGFGTERDRLFPFDEGAGEGLTADIVARDGPTEVFVECVDARGIKVSANAVYALQGRLADYRRSRKAEVIGVLAMSARDNGSNAGLRARLREHGCYLWDGTFIERMQDRMVELDRPAFRAYLLEQIGAGAGKGAGGEGQSVFIVRYSFFTVPPSGYVGGRFSTAGILDDVRSGIPHAVRIDNAEPLLVRDGDLVVYRITADFVMSADGKGIGEFAAEHRGLADRLLRRSPFDIAYRAHKGEVRRAIEAAYGVSRGSGKYSRIRLEGGRALQAGSGFKA